MTTIAYRDGVLASDSRATIGSMISDPYCKKIFRLKDGSVIGTAGNYHNGLSLIKYVSKLAEQKIYPILLDHPKCKGVTAILVDAKGHVYFYEDCVWDEAGLSKYLAIGSGQRYAYAVMDHGGTAIEAVRGGILRDVYSGGRIQTLKIRNMPKRTR